MVSENFEADLVGYGIWNGKDESSKFLLDLFQRFADLFITPITILYDNSTHNLIISEVEVEDHQLGWWNGNPSSGKKFSTMGAISIKFDKVNKIKRIGVYLNFTSIYKQLEILKF